MKKLLILACMLWSVGANAQFTPGQVLTAAELNTQFALYAPLAGATFTGSVAANAGLTASAITGTPISGSTGSFTTLSASSTVTLPTGSLPLTNLVTQAANTIVANGTGSTASPTAIAAPSCSTASSALQWASGTGLACNSAINASTLGGATFASPGSIGSTTAGSGAFTTLSSTGNFTPSQTNGIVGTTTNNNANAGSVGEFVSSSPASAGISTATATNITSVSLTAGDWDVTGNILYTSGTGTTTTGVLAGVSTTSATLPAAPNYSQVANIAVTATLSISSIAPITRVSISSTTTVYLIGYVTFSGGTEIAQGILRARRVR